MAIAKRTMRLAANVFAFLLLPGCISVPTLLANVDRRLSACLVVGLSMAKADACAFRAGLDRDTRAEAASTHEFVESANGNVLMTSAMVRVKLKFDEAGNLRTWSSEGYYEGL